MAVVSRVQLLRAGARRVRAARRLGLGKSTVHRILATLQADGFVERTRGRALPAQHQDVRDRPAGRRQHRAARARPPALERLRNESGETAHLAVLSGADVVYLDRLESPQMLRLFTQVGRRRAAHATSSGKVLLAFGIAGRRRRRPRSRPPPARSTDDHLEVDARAGARDVRRTGTRSASRRPPGCRVGGRTDLRRRRRVRRGNVGGRADHPHAAGPARPVRADGAGRRRERLVDERPVSGSGAAGRTRPCRWRRRASAPRLGARRGGSPRARRRHASSARPSRSRPRPARRPRPHRHGQRRHAELGLVDAAGVPPLADPLQLGQQHVGDDDRVAGARRQAGLQPRPRPSPG